MPCSVRAITVVPLFPWTQRDSSQALYKMWIFYDCSSRLEKKTFLFSVFSSNCFMGLLWAPSDLNCPVAVAQLVPKIIFCHISCFEIRSEDSFEDTQLSLLKVANLSIFFSKTSFCGDGSVQKERFGQVKILLDSPGVLTLHCQRLSAFLWDKCLTSSVVRFSSQLIQSVHINIYSASQAVNRDVSAWGLHRRCQRARYPSHATFTGLWPWFRLRCSWGIFGVSPEQNSSGPWQGV